jgi:hypothetical protein
VLNLCRVKLRDQERLERVGYLEEYPQYLRTDSASFMFYRQRIVPFRSPGTDSAPLGPEAGPALAPDTRDASRPSPPA